MGEPPHNSFTALLKRFGVGVGVYMFTCVYMCIGVYRCTGVFMCIGVTGVQVCTCV